MKFTSNITMTIEADSHKKAAVAMVQKIIEGGAKVKTRRLNKNKTHKNTVQVEDNVVLSQLLAIAIILESLDGILMKEKGEAQRY